MEEIIRWLLGIEKMAGQLYAGSVDLFPEDRALTTFLEHLADDESIHTLAMESALNRLHSESPLPDQAIVLEDAVRQGVETPFQTNLERLQAGELDRRSLLECITMTEFSEWNHIFLYVINLLKETSREFQYVAARMQWHQKMIRQYLASEPAARQELARINGLPRVWTEKILVVDDSEAIRELMGAILEEEAQVEKAGDAMEGMRKIETNYFDLIISDVNMPLVSGLQFYEQAVGLDPLIKDRFLFYTGYPVGETIDFIQRHDLPYILKPSRISEIRATVRRMLHDEKNRKKGEVEVL